MRRGLRHWFRKTFGAAIVGWLFGDEVSRSRADTKTAIDHYEKQPVFYASVYNIADSVSRVPLVFERVLGDEMAERLDHDHALVALFEDPNEDDTWQEVAFETSTWMEIADRGAFWELTFDGGRPVGEPRSIVPISPLLIERVPTKDRKGVQAYWHWYTETARNMRPGKPDVVFDPRAIVDFKWFSPRSRWTGQAPTKALSTALQREGAIDTYLGNFLGAGASRRVAIETDVDEVKAKEIVNRWRAKLGRPFEPVAVESLKELKELGSTPPEAGIDQIRQDDRWRIQMATGTNTASLGISERTTYNHYWAGLYAFFDRTIGPKIEKICSRATKRIARPFFGADLRIRADWKSLLPENAEVVALLARELIGRGVMLPDEFRAKYLALPPLPEGMGGDQAYMLKTIVPMGTTALQKAQHKLLEDHGDLVYAITGLREGIEKAMAC